MDNLYNYVLHYNPYQKMWFAIPTANYTRFFANSNNDEGVKRAKTVTSLIKLIK